MKSWASGLPDSPLPFYGGGLLVAPNCGLVDETTSRNHCEKLGPSDLIALSDSPSRVINFTKDWSTGRKSIAVIDVSKLLAMGVLFNRTTTLGHSIRCSSGGRSIYWIAVCQFELLGCLSMDPS
ncbi:hypothetical protein BDV26DRAFT_231146 [Aspergillus bertholletiae]|uniref:Uncharacterized protein n=1 Tax=Aspergillus bertholletiae TaxID=1226010 RepID=A0A5N7B643_9EURO|nr:hypothetical protein BDV26DRAFT_231146 [Aspergillus bertholletiae]